MFENASGSSPSGVGKPLQVFRHRAFLIFWVGACISCNSRTFVPCFCSPCSPA